MNELRYAGEPLLNEPGSMFVLPWGATPGYGVFDADAKSLSRILKKLDDSGGAATLVISDGEREVTLEDIVLVSAEPAIAKTGAPGQDVVSWRLHLADLRHRLAMRTVSGRWNVLKPDRQVYFEETASGGESSPWSWQEIVDKLADALDRDLTIVGTPVGAPVDLAWDSDSPLVLLDEVLAEISQYFVYSPISGLMEIYKSGTPAEADVSSLDALVRQLRVDGAQGIRVTRGEAPASVDVCFPIHDTSLADARTLAEDRWHAVNKVAPETMKVAAGTKRAIYYPHAWALREGITITNQEALDAIATARAEEFYAPFSVQYTDYELAGLHAISPNSVIRRVVWVSDPDPDGARTLVRVHNPDLLPAVHRSYRSHKSQVVDGTHGTNRTYEPQEGDGVFLQRSGPSGISRPRLQAERFSFWARITSNLGDDGYMVRRIDKDGNYLGPAFLAQEIALNQTGVVGDPVEVLSDGVGNYCFFYRAGVVRFAGACLVKEEHPVNKYPNSSGVTVFSTGTGDSVQPAYKTMALCKLARAMPIRSASILHLPCEFGCTWILNNDFDANTLSLSAITWLYYIIEDFAYEDGATVTVTGDGNYGGGESPNGLYAQDGEANGKSRYVRSAEITWELTWDGVDRWSIHKLGETPGVDPDWFRDEPGFLGGYTGRNGATGSPEVAGVECATWETRPDMTHLTEDLQYFDLTISPMGSWKYHNPDQDGPLVKHVEDGRLSMPGHGGDWFTSTAKIYGVAVHPDTWTLGYNASTPPSLEMNCEMHVYPSVEHGLLVY